MGHRKRYLRETDGSGWEMTTQTEVVGIHDLAAELMSDAKQHHSQRSARTLASGIAQRATLIGMAQGAELAKHDAPTAATIQILAGSVRLHTAEREWRLNQGDFMTSPVERHAVYAQEDAAILLTVALR